MAWKLRLPASGYITIPTWTVAANQDFVIEAVFDTPAVVDTDGVLGNLEGDSYLATLAINNGAVLTKLADIFINGDGNAPVNQNIFAPSNKYSYKVQRTSNLVRTTVTNLTTGTVRQDISGVVFSNAISFTRIGNTQTYTLGGGSFYTVQLSRSGDNRYYDANASGGTGVVLPDTVNSANNGTQSGTGWPANDGEWVFYNSITALPIPNNTLGAALNQACAINLNNYFTGATSYSVLSGSLPTGLSISGNQIVGTPTTADSTTLVIRASNSIDTLDSATITFNTGLWYLLCAGGTGSTAPIVTIPDWTPSNQSNWACRLKIRTGSNITTDRMLLGRDDDNTNTNQGFKFAINNGSVVVLYKTYWNTTNWLQYAISANTEYDFLYKVTATTFELWNNATNTLLVSKTLPNRAASNTVMGTSVVGQNAKSNSSLNQSPAGVGYYNVDFIDYATPSNSRYYDANLSGGVGTKLLTVEGTNNGTQAGTWPAGDSEWVFYSSLYVGEGTISFSAAAAAAVASAKVGNVTVSAIATTVEDIQGSKIGFAPLNSPISAGIAVSASKVGEASFSMPINAVLGIAAHKVGVAPLYIEAVTDVSLYAGNIYIGEGTFSVTATASATLQGEKVGKSQVQFVATAALFCTAAKLSGSDVSASANATAQLQASKTGQSTTHLAASASASVDSYKVGLGTVAALASITISLSGSNPGETPTPVTLVFVRSSSRHTHNMRTSSRYNYNIKTSSGGARV